MYFLILTIVLAPDNSFQKDDTNDYKQNIW